MNIRKKIMNKTTLIFAMLFTFLLLSTATKASVIEQNKMANAVAGVDKDTLVVFDIDNTILETAQTFGSDAWFYKTRDRLMSEGMNKEDATIKIFKQWRTLQLFTTVKPVESTTPELIKQLQDKGVKVVALTARSLELVEVTKNMLKSIGVDLGRNSISSKDFEISSKGGEAKYNDGIVFCGGLKSDKGLILSDILKKLKLSPKKIVFVDDKKSNVEAVDSALASKGIECDCVRYGAADYTYKEYDQAIVDVEQEFFGKILPDDAAKAILKLRSKKR